MRFRVGQRVRLLHEKSEGVITALIDKHHVEVDTDDDFPIEAHIDDVIALTGEDSLFYSEKEEAAAPDVVGKMGRLFECSLAVVPGEEEMKIHLLNPEPLDLLFTIYVNRKGKYYGWYAGKISPMSHKHIGDWPLKTWPELKGWYIQLLGFKGGKGHPHGMEVAQLPAGKAFSGFSLTYIELLQAKGWIHSLRKKMTEVEEKIEELGASLKKPDKPPRGKKEVDLHLEKLVSDPHRISLGEMLAIQMKAAEKAVSEAMETNCETLVLIHGVGTGALKKSITELLKGYSSIKEFKPADPAKYGNGATEVVFK